MNCSSWYRWIQVFKLTEYHVFASTFWSAAAVIFNELQNSSATLLAFPFAKTVLPGNRHCQLKRTSLGLTGDCQQLKFSPFRACANLARNLAGTIPLVSSSDFQWCWHRNPRYVCKSCRTAPVFDTEWCWRNTKITALESHAGNIYLAPVSLMCFNSFREHLAL